MTTIEMIDLIRAGQATLGRQVLLHIADRLEAHDRTRDGMMNSIHAQEHQLCDMGGKLAESERHRQILTTQNTELLARCDLLEAEKMDLQEQAGRMRRCLSEARVKIGHVEQLLISEYLDQHQNLQELASIS